MALSEARIFNMQKACKEDANVDRVFVLNWLIEHNGYERYLEIGCRGDHCFSRICAPVKVGVDPQAGGTHKMKSDEFFAKVNVTTFDLVFVDGLHECSQVLRDVDNSLNCLRPGGVIVLHDCYPLTYRGSLFPFPPNETYVNGSVYKALWKLRGRADLDVRVLNADWGLGVIQKLEVPVEKAIRFPSRKDDAQLYKEYSTNIHRIAGLMTWNEMKDWLPTRPTHETRIRNLEKRVEQLLKEKI